MEKKQEIRSPAYNSYNRIQRAILGFIRNSNRYEKLNEYEMYIVSSYWINTWIKSLKNKNKVTECKIINNLDEIKNLIYNGKEFKFVDDSFINNIKKPYIKNTIQPFKIYFGNNKIILDIDNNSILLIMTKEDLKHSNYYIIKCLDFGKKIEKNKKNDFIKTILYEDINKLIKNQKEKNFDISEIKKENKDIKPVISEDKLEKSKENNISNQIINNNNSQIRESIQIQESIAQNLEQTMTKSYINNHQIEESIKESIPKIQDKPMIKAEIINNQKENYIKESIPNFQEQTIIKTEYPQIIINQEKTPQKKEDLKISKNSLKKEEEKVSYYEDEKFIKSYEKKIGESLIQDLLNDDLNKLNSQNKLKSQCENDIFSITNKINEILNEIKDLNDDKQNKFKINKITASFLSYKPKNEPTEKQLKNREEFDQIYNSLKQKEKKDKINKLYKQKEILENKLKEKNIFLEEIENEIYSIKQNMYEHNNLINKSRLLEKSIKEIEKLNIINKNKDELKLLQSKLKRIEYDNTQKEMALEAKRKIEEKKKKELEDIMREKNREYELKNKMILEEEEKRKKLLEKEDFIHKEKIKELNKKQILAEERISERNKYIKNIREEDRNKYKKEKEENMNQYKILLNNIIKEENKEEIEKKKKQDQEDLYKKEIEKSKERQKLIEKSKMKIQIKLPDIKEEIKEEEIDHNELINKEKDDNEEEIKKQIEKKKEEAQIQMKKEKEEIKIELEKEKELILMKKKMDEEEIRKKKEKEEKERQEKIKKEMEEKMRQELIKKQKEFEEKMKQEQIKKQKEFEEKKKQEGIKKQKELEEKMKQQKELEEKLKQQKLLEEKIKQEKLLEEKIKQKQLLEEKIKQEKLLEEKKKLEEQIKKQKELEEQMKKQKLFEEQMKKQKLLEEQMKKQKLLGEQMKKQKELEEQIKKQKLLEEQMKKQKLLGEQMKKQKELEEKMKLEKKLKEEQLKKQKEEEEKLKKKKQSLTCKSFKIPPLIGLQNIGSTCYMNATLQCFSHTEVLTNYFLNENNYNKIYNNNIAKINPQSLQLSPSYLDLINNLWRKKHKYYPPTEFRKRLADMNPLFVEGTPNDAKDLLTYLLMQLHEELNLINGNNNNNDDNINIDQYNEQIILQNFVKSFFGMNKSILSDHFFGIQESKFLCLGCEKKNINKMNPPIKYNFQTFNFLVFPLEEIRIFKNNNNMMNNMQMVNNMNNNQFNMMNNMNMNMFPFNNFGNNNMIINNIIIQNNNNPNTVNIYDCFDYFQKDEVFSGENAMWCNSCNGLIPCKNKTMIYTGPNILIMILNRGVGIQYKVKLDFYEVINLDKYIIKRDKPNMFYDLYGVVTHLGESGASGHFVASCKSPCDNHWYRYNDAIVNPINDVQTEIINFGMPYILFYKKRE